MVILRQCTFFSLASFFWKNGRKVTACLRTVCTPKPALDNKSPKHLMALVQNTDIAEVDDKSTYERR